MAAEYVCKSCVKVLRNQNALRTQGETISRRFRLYPYSSRRNLFSSKNLAQTTSTAKIPPTAQSTKSDLTRNGDARTNDTKRASSTTASQGQKPSNNSEGSSSLNQRFREGAQRMAGGISLEYSVYGSSERMYELCAQQADYTIPQAQEKDGIIPRTDKDEDVGVGNSWWYSELGLTPTFNNWAHVTMLYLYALLVRLRYLPADETSMFHQHLNNAYFVAAEHRMIMYHRINIGGIRQRYLKDLFAQWRGAILAYDEGLIKGDAVLATAIWRNVFKADEAVNLETVATVTSYLRRCLRMLDKMQDDQVRRVEIQWPGLEQEQVLVRAESPQLKMPFVEAAKI